MKKILFLAVTAIAVLATGCTRETGNEGEEGLGSLKITIAGDTGSATRAIGNEPTQGQENRVFSFAVYVFNGNGNLEKSEIFDNGLTGTITDLSTNSTKRVVVLVNYEYDKLVDENGDPLTTYDQFNEGVLNIDSQFPGDFSTYGLFMSGEVDGVQLTSGQTEQITIPVQRVVAKVRLVDLIIDPDANSDLSLFEITGVSMQKVPYWAYMLGDEIPELDPTIGEYVGGIAGDVSVLLNNVDLLYTEYEPDLSSASAFKPDIYFYVFPNDDYDDHITLLTIEGFYDGERAYYTFPINNKVGDQNTDGTFITRNTIYNLYVTLRSLSAYVTDPDDDALANIEVTIEVLNWNPTIYQNVTW